MSLEKFKRICKIILFDEPNTFQEDRNRQNTAVREWCDKRLENVRTFYNLEVYVTVDKQMVTKIPWKFPFFQSYTQLTSSEFYKLLGTLWERNQLLLKYKPYVRKHSGPTNERNKNLNVMIYLARNLTRYNVTWYIFHIVWALIDFSEKKNNWKWQKQ